MILPDRVLGKPGAQWITSGGSDGADFCADLLDEFGFEIVGIGFAHVEGDVGIDALSFDFVWETHYSGFGHFSV